MTDVHRCPRCGGPSVVVETRAAVAWTRRVRACVQPRCLRRWRTHEVAFNVRRLLAAVRRKDWTAVQFILEADPATTRMPLGGQHRQRAASVREYK